MKQYIFSLLLLLPLSVAYADAADGYAARIAELERQVARLTEQVNHLLAERLPPAPHGNAVYVCKIKAFTDTFRSEHRSQGRAKLAALKQCRAKHNDMFCKPEQVSCEVYQ